MIPFAALQVSISESYKVYIYSAAFKPEGRRFELIGTFINSTRQIDAGIFPNERYILNGRHFRVGFVKVKFTSSTKGIFFIWNGQVDNSYVVMWKQVFNRKMWPRTSLQQQIKPRQISHENHEVFRPWHPSLLIILDLLC